jgi:hypothetical protein
MSGGQWIIALIIAGVLLNGAVDLLGDVSGMVSKKEWKKLLKLVALIAFGIGFWVLMYFWMRHGTKHGA